MKFWKKIFIYSITVFIILFNGAGIMIIENIHKRNLDAAIISNLKDYDGIVGAIRLNSDLGVNFNTNNRGQLSAWFQVIINSYISSSNEGSNIEIYDENSGLIVSRSNIEPHRKDDEELHKLLNGSSDEKTFIIKTIGDKKVLFITSKFKALENDLKLLVSHNITSLYDQRIANYVLFFLIDLFVTILLALIMYFISKKITRAIEELSSISKEVATGKYTERVDIHNRKDEVGILANNFNIMLDVIEENISKLKNMNEEKERFIDSLTHEIKTPITSIIGYSDLLLKGNVNETITLKALKYINSEGKRLETLNSTLLKLIMIKGENLEWERLSIEVCVKKSMNTLAYNLESKDIKVTVNVMPTYITGDEQLILVLIINILDNAVKASKEGGNINIKGEVLEGGKYVLSIRDYGIGISTEELNKIKEPFYMVDKSRGLKNNGVGLGLSICEAICQIHNIKFQIQSKVNSGTEVIFEFSREVSYE